MRRLAALLLVGAWLAGCGVAGGGFELVNESRTWLSATVWTREPGDGERFLPRVSRLVGPSGSMTLEGDALGGIAAAVRLQIEALGPEVRTPASIWYELDPPMPMRVRAWGSGSELWFERSGRGEGMRPLSPLAARLIPPPEGGPSEPGPWLPTLGPEATGDSVEAWEAGTLPKSEQEP